MSTNNEITMALERLNKELIDLQQSQEYIKGQSICSYIHEIKQGNLKQLILKIKKKHSAKKQIVQLKRKEDVNVSTKTKNNSDKKIAVYSCITGGYDKLQEPFFYPFNIDYIMYLSNVVCESQLGWSIRNIPDDILKLKDNSLINRYIKFHPFELLGKDYDYSIYIDGNITPVTDLTIFTEKINPEIGIAMHMHSQRNCVYDEAKACMILGKGQKANIEKQIKRYEDQGFPHNYGLLECNVIAVDLHNRNAKRIFDKWWEELMISKSGRDQLAFPYVLWTQGIEVEQVGTIGNNVFRNSKIQVHKHK